MKTILLNTIIKLGLNKALLKLSCFVSIFTTGVTQVVSDNAPTSFLGVTIFLWIIYVCTVFLDWMTGITAAKVEAKRNKVKFVWDVDKSMTNFFKHALFVIIMATVYFFQKEVMRNEFGDLISTLLLYIQYCYFGYNMVNEWISIEENRHKVTGKYSRLYKFLNRLLNLFDEAAINKIEKLTNTKEDEVSK